MAQRAQRLAGMAATAGLLLVATAAAAAEPSLASASATDYTADGRLPLAQIDARFATLATRHGWRAETVYAYPAAADGAIRAWRTAKAGPALWILAGIHGEEPAGPNALARELASLAEIAADGVPVVVLPLCNPKAYRRNWRYPNTAERDWRQGGYSVGDAEYLLPDLTAGTAPRAPEVSGPETQALTQYVLRLAADYPPQLVLDLHEDELSTAGGYIYSQGRHADANPVGAEIVRLLQQAGIPLRRSGQTRFGETIVDGVISRDDAGGPIRDGSIDELLAAPSVFVDGQPRPGPRATTVIVVETPAFAGARFDQRVAAQGAVLRQLRQLWQLNAALR